jgi:hypothetical protein
MVEANVLFAGETSDRNDHRIILVKLREKAS